MLPTASQRVIMYSNIDIRTCNVQGFLSNNFSNSKSYLNLSTPTARQLKANLSMRLGISAASDLNLAKNSCNDFEHLCLTVISEAIIFVPFRLLENRIQFIRIAHELMKRGCKLLNYFNVVPSRYVQKIGIQLCLSGEKNSFSS